MEGLLGQPARQQKPTVVGHDPDAPAAFVERAFHFRHELVERGGNPLGKVLGPRVARIVQIVLEAP